MQRKCEICLIRFASCKNVNSNSSRSGLLSPSSVGRFRLRPCVFVGRPVCRPGRHLLRVRWTGAHARATGRFAGPRGPPQPVLLCRALVAGGRAAARSTVRLWVSQLWDLDIRHGSLACSFVVHSSIPLRCFGFLTGFDSFILLKYNNPLSSLILLFGV